MLTLSPFSSCVLRLMQPTNAEKSLSITHSHMTLFYTLVKSPLIFSSSYPPSPLQPNHKAINLGVFLFSTLSHSLPFLFSSPASPPPVWFPSSQLRQQEQQLLAEMVRKKREGDFLEQGKGRKKESIVFFFYPRCYSSFSVIFSASSQHITVSL